MDGIRSLLTLLCSQYNIFSIAILLVPAAMRYDEYAVNKFLDFKLWLAHSDDRCFFFTHTKYSQLFL